MQHLDEERLISSAVGELLREEDVSPSCGLRDATRAHQLFALFHAGIVPWAEGSCAAGEQQCSSQVLGRAAARLLDARLAAAQALPQPVQRCRAAAQVVAAYCHAALRESAARAATAAAAALHPADCSAAAASAVPMDADFLDTAFSVLAAVASRHGVVRDGLRLSDLAAGVRPSSLAGGPAGAAVAPAGIGIGGEWVDGRHAGAVDGAQQAALLLAEYLAEPECQAQLAAGVLLYGGAAWPERGGGAARKQPACLLHAAAGANARTLVGGSRSWLAEQVEALCEAPVLVELCAAAALAESWPQAMSCAAAGGPVALASWLQGRAAAGGDGGRCPAALDWSGKPEVPRSVSIMAAAARERPQVVMKAVAPQVLTALAAGSTHMRDALVGGIASLLPAARLAGEATAGACAAALELGASSAGLHPDPQLLSAVRQVQAWLGAVGLDLGQLLQEHVVAVAADVH